MPDGEVQPMVATGGDSKKLPLLQLRGLTKNFGAVQALQGVNFEVHSGEVVGLVGDNGAGKSTMIKIVSGVFQPNSGQIIFDGHPVVMHSPHDANALGIETVYQDLALCDNLDVVANLFLGREAVPADFPGTPLSEAEMEKRSYAVLQTLHIRIPSIRAPVGALSGGQRQSIAVGRAVLWGSRLVLLDEPTAALGVAQQREVLDLILRLKRQGLAVVVISHNLKHVFDVADRIFVLRLGQGVANVQKGEATGDTIVGYITGTRTERALPQAEA